MDKKLNVKDLVNIGIFVVIYFVVMFAVGMIGIVPILFLIWPTVLGMLSGVVVMLFMAKVQKPWAFFIFGILSPAIMVVMGHTMVLLIHSIVVMLVAEFVRKLGNYKSFKTESLAYAIFNLWCCGSLIQMLVVRDKYIEMSRKMMDEAYINRLSELVTIKNMSLVYVGAFLGAIVGAYLAKAMLKKHFIKAGII